MARQDIPLTEALRDSNPKVNANFTELYDRMITEAQEAKLDRHKDSGLIEGANLRWDSGTAYSLTPGRAMVNGTLLTWAADISRTPAIAANTLYYVYLYDSAGTPALEESTTAPVWDSVLDYYTLGGGTPDASRRCLGYISANGTPAIRRFVAVAAGRQRELTFVASEQYFAVNNLASDAAWTSYTLLPIVPEHATHYYAATKIYFPADGNDAILAVSPVDLGGSSASLGPFTVRMAAGRAGLIAFFGRAWLPISASNTNYYRTQQILGSNTAYIELHGARFGV